MLPNLIVIGAMKAGTSSLHEYLGRHPQVFMSEPKELRFFMPGPDGRWDRGREWYEAHFDASGAALVRGESSPGYSKREEYPGVPSRMAGLVGDARLLYIVRDPVERMHSHYEQFVYDGWEHRAAVRALLDERQYLSASSYAFQIDAYLEHFERDRLLVITSEELRDRRLDVLARVATFLGLTLPWPGGSVDAEHHRTEAKLLPRAWRTRVSRIPGYRAVQRLTPGPLRRTYHRASTRPPGSARPALPRDVVDELRERLRPDVARLREHLGPDFDGWGIA